MINSLLDFDFMTQPMSSSESKDNKDPSVPKSDIDMGK